MVHREQGWGSDDEVLSSLAISVNTCNFRCAGISTELGVRPVFKRLKHLVLLYVLLSLERHVVLGFSFVK